MAILAGGGSCFWRIRPFTETAQLLETTPQFVYQAQSGLTGRDGPDNPANGPRPLYNVDKEAFVLADGQDELVIPLTYTDKAGNVFTKTFTLKRGGYAVNVGYSVQNAKGVASSEVSTFGHRPPRCRPVAIRRPVASSTMHTFRGAAFSTAIRKYENINSIPFWITKTPERQHQKRLGCHYAAAVTTRISRGITGRITLHRQPRQTLSLLAV